LLNDFVVTPMKQTSLAQADRRKMVITLIRPMCGLGTLDCYDYKLTIYGDGTVIYEETDTKVGVEKYITETEIIGQDRGQELISEFEKVDYFSLRDDYPARATDCGGAATSITAGAKRKFVINSHCSDAPTKLAKLENKIDEMVDPKQFRHPSPQP
jgi:hypothetical protein